MNRILIGENRISLLLKYIILLSLFTVLLSGCSNIDNNELNNNIIEKTPKGANNIKTKKPKVKIDHIKEKVKSMTLDEKIGQLFMVGIDDYIVNEDTKKLIENYNIGGIILFKRNVKNSGQLLNLINDLKDLNFRNDNIPLFLSVDEEGGRVTRLPKEIKKLPSSKVVGDIDDKKFAYRVGESIGNMVSNFGFNMALTPVLDVNSNPNNPVIGDRSFGSSKEVVSKLGVSEMKGIQSKGVIPVIKHFPGHGDTSVDSHVGLPIINHDINRLESLEFTPFKRAVENGADMTMIAHILLPKIDPDNPSTLSKKIIDDILRGKLNFKGVIITDDLTMGAIVKNYDIKEVVTRAILAGNDILTICHGYDDIIDGLTGVKKAVDNGSISESRIDESVYRILKLKEKYDIKDEVLEDIDVKEINDKTLEVINTYLN